MANQELGAAITSATPPRTPLSLDPLDQDLRDRLTSVTTEYRMGSERFGSSQRLLIESGLWVALGALAWLLTLLFWK